MSPYEVMCPPGEPTQSAKQMQSRLRDPDGMTIGEPSKHQFQHELTFAVVRNALLERYPGVKIVPFETSGNIDEPNREADVVAALPDKPRSYRCDAVVTGNGG